MTPTKKQELEEKLANIIPVVMLHEKKVESIMALFTHYLQEEVEQASPLKLRRMILRFYASMQDRPYDSVVDEYLGKKLELDFDERELVNNKLYMATEAAIASYLAPPQHPVKEKE